MPRRKKADNVIDLTQDDENEPQQPAPPKYELERQYVDSDAEPGPSQPKKKRAKKADKPPVEKRVDVSGRVVRFAPKASLQTQDRMARTAPGSGHRLFLIDRKTIAPPHSPGGASEEFAVLGATGNCYRVIISRSPSCTCPDSQKGNVCKHRLFVMLRVLKLAPTDPVVWQRALLPSEADAALANAPPAGDGDGVLASAAVVERYRRLSGAGGEAGRRLPIQPGDECAICGDEMRAGATSAADKVTFCGASCGNNVHVQCIQHWLTARAAQGLTATCPFCRASFVDGLNPTAAPAAGASGGFINLAEASEAHRNADTSLHSLYGDRAIWIQAHMGQVPLGQAAATWRALQG